MRKDVALNQGEAFKRRQNLRISREAQTWFYALMLPEFPASFWQLALEPAPLIEPLALIKPRALINPSKLIEPRELIEAERLIEPSDLPPAPSWIAPRPISGPKPCLS